MESLCDIQLFNTMVCKKFLIRIHNYLDGFELVVEVAELLVYEGDDKVPDLVVELDGHLHITKDKEVTQLPDYNLKKCYFVYKKIQDLIVESSVAAFPTGSEYTGSVKRKIWSLFCYFYVHLL